MDHSISRGGRSYRMLREIPLFSLENDEIVIHSSTRVSERYLAINSKFGEKLFWSKKANGTVADAK